MPTALPASIWPLVQRLEGAAQHLAGEGAEDEAERDHAGDEGS